MSLRAKLRAAAIVACLAPRVARAEDEAAEKRPPEDFPRVAVLANPFNAVFNRASLDLHWVFLRHHAVVANAFLGTTARPEELLGGGELGYRLYTGENGPNGFFIGASLVSGAPKRGLGPFVSSELRGAELPGGALDVGGQHVFADGLVIGAGVGLRITDRRSSDPPVLPRALFALGYAF